MRESRVWTLLLKGWWDSYLYSGIDIENVFMAVGQFATREAARTHRQSGESIVYVVMRFYSEEGE